VVEHNLTPTSAISLGANFVKLKSFLRIFIRSLLKQKQDWAGQNATQIVTEMCGFVTILSGTFLLHKTKDMVDTAGMPSFFVHNSILRHM
jgi:Magnesium transporter NIPA